MDHIQKWPSNNKSFTTFKIPQTCCFCVLNTQSFSEEIYRRLTKKSGAIHFFKNF